MRTLIGKTHHRHHLHHGHHGGRLHHGHTNLDQLKHMLKSMNVKGGSLHAKPHKKKITI